MNIMKIKSNLCLPRETFVASAGVIDQDFTI